MPSQNNSGNQFDERHAVTLVATAALAANRFIAYDGGYATSAGGVKDAQGVSKHAAAVDEAVAITTSYSQLVEAGAAISFGDYVKPGANGVAVVGTITDCCGRALGAAALGQLVEVQITRHVHA